MTEEPQTQQQEQRAQAPMYRNTQLPAVVRAEHFVAATLSDKGLDILAKSMPDHIDKDRFKRNLVTAVAHHDKLLDCDPRAVFHEAGKASALGFYLDPAMGEAYLITGFDSKKGGLVPQLRIGYRGLIKLARQSGMISKMYAHEVRANDPRKITLGVHKDLVHDPDPFASEEERGPVVGYYAVVHYTNGDFDFEPMGMDAINRIRDRSDGWKAFQSGRIKSTPWGTDPDEMGKKTALRRLSKRTPQSPEMAEAWSIEDRADFSGAESLTEVTPRLPRASRFLASRDAKEGGFHPDHIREQLDPENQAQEGGEPSSDTDAINDPVPPADGQEEAGGEGGADDGVVDADFEEVEKTMDEPEKPDAAAEQAIAEVTEVIHQARGADQEQATDFPGDRAAPASEPTPDKTPPEKTATKTVGQRADDYEVRLKSATNPTKLKSIYAAGAQLRKDLDNSDPERLSELEQLFTDRLNQLEEIAEEEKRAAAKAQTKEEGQ